MTTPEQSGERQRKIQRQLDEALAQSFPASDPVSIVTSQNEEAWEEPAAAAESAGNCAEPK